MRRIAGLLLGIGGLFLAGGLALGWGSLRHVLYADRAEGEVVEIRREGSMYAPVVRFRLPGGEAQQVKDLGNGAPDFAVGDKITILYMPRDPEDFRLDTFDRLWFSPILVMVFACFWLLFGAVAWALSRGVDVAVVGERAFTVIAAGAAVIGTIALWNAVDLYTDGLRADGTVVEIRETRRTEEETVTRSDGSETRRQVERYSFAPVVRFTTIEGREIEFHGRGGSETSLVEGDHVTVIYDPTNPIRASIATFLDFWLPSFVAFVVMLRFGGAVLLSRRSRRAWSN